MNEFKTRYQVSDVIVTLKREGKVFANFPKGAIYPHDANSEVNQMVSWQETYIEDGVTITASVGRLTDKSNYQQCEIYLRWDVIEALIQRLGEAHRGKDVELKPV
jgi:hypothetical protein